jgi:hypothetical protein
VDELDRFAHRRAAAIHRPHLDDLVVATGSLDHLTPFGERVCRRLLDVHVLARLQRPYGRERMPVVRRGDDHRVDVLVVEHAAEILLEARAERRDVRELLVVDALVGEVRVDVAERLDLDVLQLREAPLERVALPADADARQHDAIVRAAHAP